MSTPSSPRFSTRKDRAERKETMSSYYDSESDGKTLIGTVTSPEYAFQKKQQELHESFNDQPDDLEDSQDQQSLEELTWLGAIVINSVLIKKACEHSSCSHFRCDRGL